MSTRSSRPTAKPASRMTRLRRLGERIDIRDQILVNKPATGGVAVDGSTRLDAMRAQSGAACPVVPVVEAHDFSCRRVAQQHVASTARERQDQLLQPALVARVEWRRGVSGEIP